MKELRSEIRINAPAAKVWEKLTDFGEYPKWNPFITKVEAGKLVAGATLKIRVEPPEDRAVSISCEVLVVDPGKELAWVGVMGLAAIFQGTHYMQLVENNDGTTTFINGEEFQGLMIPYMTKLIDHNLARGYELMNRGLKKICESKV